MRGTLLPVALRRIANRFRRVGRAPVRIWHHPEYRLPVSSAERALGIEPRRADFVAGYLLDAGVVEARALRRPRRIAYSELSLAHSTDLLERLHDVGELARIFAADPSEFRVDEVMRTVRLACGGTLAATEWALLKRSCAFNLLGGFHHAGPDRGGGLCPVNDIATAVAVLRARGFSGRVNIIDLDAHPPDGTSECLGQDPKVWIGSISGCDWGPLPGVDETVLSSGAADAEYLATLGALLARMPKAELYYVLAGGDVLAGDRLGGLGLTLEGVRQRDLLVSWYVGEHANVWLPAGGYHADSWKALAGSVLAAALDSEAPIIPGYDPLRSGFARIGQSLDREELEGLKSLTMADLLGDLGMPHGSKRFLGFYTRDGCEYALQRYGILRHLERIGYSDFEVELDDGGSGDRMRLFGHASAQRHLLVECVAEINRTEMSGALAQRDVLFVNWLTLRDPRSQFSARRPRLPGQDHPGLGLAKEAGELLRRISRRLGLSGVAFRPASYHLAYAARHDTSFVDPERQGRFEALVRDLAGVPLLEASRLIASGKIQMNGQPYSWEADLMVHWHEVPDLPDAQGARAARVEAARDATHFERAS